jgi:hypothetical protein
VYVAGEASPQNHFTEAQSNIGAEDVSQFIHQNDSTYAAVDAPLIEPKHRGSIFYKDTVQYPTHTTRDKIDQNRFGMSQQANPAIFSQEKVKHTTDYVKNLSQNDSNFFMTNPNPSGGKIPFIKNLNERNLSYGKLNGRNLTQRDLNWGHTLSGADGMTLSSTKQGFSFNPNIRHAQTMRPGQGLQLSNRHENYTSARNFFYEPDQSLRPVHTMGSMEFDDKKKILFGNKDKWKTGQTIQYFFCRLKISGVTVLTI